MRYKRAMQRCCPLLHSLDKKIHSLFYPLRSIVKPVAILYVLAASYFSFSKMALSRGSVPRKAGHALHYT